MNRYFPLILVFAVAISCNRRTEQSAIYEVNADINSSIQVELDSLSHPIALESTEIFGGISNVIFTDSSVFIHSNGTANEFKLADGAFSRKISRKGRAGNEYLSLPFIWYDNGSLCLFDLTGMKIIRYSIADDRYSSSSIHYSEDGRIFQSLIRLDKEGYIGKCMFGDGDVHALAFYDNDLNFISYIGEERIKSGIGMHVPFCKSDKGVLYNKYFSTDILEINRDGICKKYHISFPGYQAAPIDDFNDDFEYLEYLNARKSKVATLVSNIYESKKLLCFSFLVSEAGKRFLIYDRKDGRTHRIYEFRHNGQCLDNITMTVTSEILNVFVQEQDKDILLYRIPLETLL